MDEDNKPKIDLKSRLGKKPVGGPAPAASIPGSLPPMGHAPVPAPPFGSQPSGPQPFGSHSQPPAAVPSRPPAAGGPPFGAPSQPPFGAPSAPVAVPGFAQPAPGGPSIRPKAQAITVEMSPEVIAAQKAGRSRIAILAAVTAVVGGVVGFAVGSGAERGKAAEAAVEGAKQLTTDIETANKKITELSDVLKSAREKLAKATFPEEEVSKLGGINIPFGGTNLSGKGIGRFKADVVKMLIDFAASVEAANDQKEKLQNLLSGNKKGVQEFLEEQASPAKQQVRWSVVVADGPYGPWASMHAVPSPFLVKSDAKVKDKKGVEKAYSWPEDFKIGAGDKGKSYKRYAKGAPGDADFIPVDPNSQARVCPSDTVVRLRSELSKMETVLKGEAPSGTGDEKPGLLDSGTKLLKKLKEIGKES